MAERHTSGNLKMDKEIIFTERQRFKQWWLWFIFLAINGLLWFGIIRQVFWGKQFGNKPMGDTGLIFLTVFILILTLLFVVCRLDKTIRKDGIYVRFFPFHLKFKYFSWDSVTKAFVRPYSPLAEYGGWGIRLGFFGNGTAYNVSGNQGLQLEFSDKKKLLIGTNKPDELTEMLKKIGQLKHSQQTGTENNQEKSAREL